MKPMTRIKFTKLIFVNVRNYLFVHAARAGRSMGVCHS